MMDGRRQEMVGRNKIGHKKIPLTTVACHFGRQPF